MAAPRKPADPPAFTAEERAAMQERAKESKAARRGVDPADAAADVLEKIAGMDERDRIMAERVHAVVTATAPELAPRLWYGSPAWTKDGKLLLFFQETKKFKTRYATLGFGDLAVLDDGAMWPSSFALMEVTPEVEERIAALVRRAIG